MTTTDWSSYQTKLNLFAAAAVPDEGNCNENRIYSRACYEKVCKSWSLVYGHSSY